MITRELVFTLLGGLGLFIYGMSLMGEGLRKIAGEKLRTLLERLTTNPVAGVVTGAIVTAALQSSSATSVMVVGFVNAGLMPLPAAVSVIMGANIGTTATAQMIAFRLEHFGPPAIALGVALSLFPRRKRYRYVGQAVLGFGMLFTGMGLMKSAVAPLRGIDAFGALLLRFQSNPGEGIIAGFALTAILQSSSATMGILQALASQGLLPIGSAMPMIYGENIGTTVTALLSSIGASVAARRAALSHLLFNVVGTALFIALTPVMLPIITAMSPDPVRQLANTHTIFNLANVAFQLPFLGILVFVVRRLVPGEEVEIEHGPRYLEERLLDSPAIAIEQASRESIRMLGLVREAFLSSLDGFLKDDRDVMEKVARRETVVNALERETTKYLVALTKRTLSERESDRVNLLLNNLNDIERVGDHAENIAELAEFRLDGALPLSPKAMVDLDVMGAQCLDILEKTETVMETGSHSVARQIIALEELVDDCEKTFRRRHIGRLYTGECHPASGVVFLDVISNLERIADHGANIARRYLDRKAN